MKRIGIGIILLLLTLTLAACRSGSVTIEFDTRSEDTIDAMTVKEGSTIDLPVPEKEANNFIGWYDVSTQTLFTSADEVEKDTVLYAKYEPMENVDYHQYHKDTNPIVTIEIRGYGVMRLELYPDIAPNTVTNFIHHIESGYYDGLTFHRIIEDFMIQSGRGGAVDCNIEGEFGYNDFANPLSHSRGVISMARTQVYDSASTQFFIVHVTSARNVSALDNQYAAFGGLLSGFSILDAIATTETYTDDGPIDDIVITKMTVDTKDINYGEPDCIQ
jgi:peptidyl-prolyl cis-trans isomerase B (cyclophilin B)